MPAVRVLQPMGDGGAGDVSVPWNRDGDFDVSGPLPGLRKDRSDRNSIEVCGGDCEGAVGDVPGDGEVDDAGGEGVVGDDAVSALGNVAAGVAVLEGGVGDAPGVGLACDADCGSAAGDAPGVGAAVDANVEGAAGDAMVDRAAGAESWRKARGGHGRPVKGRGMPLSWLSESGPGT